MPTDKEISFTLSYPVGMGWEKPTIVQTLLEGEDAVIAIQNLKARMYKMYGVVELSGTTTLQALSQIPIEKAKSKAEVIEGIIRDINACTTIPKPEGIEAFRSLAETMPEVYPAFEEKYLELSNNLK